jgi:hypothetical protein
MLIDLQKRLRGIDAHRHLWQRPIRQVDVSGGVTIVGYRAELEEAHEVANAVANSVLDILAISVVIVVTVCQAIAIIVQLVACDT